MLNSYFPQLIRESNQIEDTMQTKRIIISLDGKDFYIVFHDFGHGSGYYV